MEAVSCDICGGGPERVVRPAAETRIVRCRRCGLAYLDPRPTPEELARFYESDYYQSEDPLQHGYEDYEGLAASVKHMARVKTRIVRSRVSGGRLLDVGAAYGHFASAATRAGFDARGVELSAHAAETARERLGANVMAGTIADVDAPAGSFDVVTMWDVLEHAHDARATLASAAELLRPGGFVFLTVPNAGSFIARLMGARWFGFQKLEHTYYFTPRTLGVLLERAGFADARFHAASWSCSLDYVVRRIGHYSTHLAGWGLALSTLLGLNDTTIDFRWIDMLAVARKREAEPG